MASSVFDLIEGTVRKHPERTAFLSRQGERVTYARLEEIVNALSRHAAAAGVTRGHHVAFQTDPPEWRLCMQLALSKIGAVWVPALPPGVAKKAGLRIDFVVLGPLTGPSIIDYAILSSSSMLAGPNVIRMNERWLDPNTAPKVSDAGGLQSEDDPALIFPSSGTTGVPKPTCFSLSILRSRVEDMLPIVGRLKAEFSCSRRRNRISDSQCRSLLCYPAVKSCGREEQTMILHSFLMARLTRL
jgi:acyl-coenzyme A synthetase/AMP-(fatty) acid ligase